LRQEVASLASAEEAATWARRALAAKNTLTAADGELIEEAFRERLATVAPSESASEPISSAGTTAAGRPANITGDQEPRTSGVPLVMSVPRFSEGEPEKKVRRRKAQPGLRAAAVAPPLPMPAVNILAEEFMAEGTTAPTIDRGALALSEPRRYRDRDHLNPTWTANRALSV
ncbi:MAG TPA: hypothetical protein VKB89_08870, partial [Xanthobacteraceae bacterium]|nr:hypothetical protein [Xanthobacteraceae bacterium]